MSIALGNSLSKGGLTGPTIVTDNLVLKHKYDAGAVVPVSDGAASFNGSSEYIDLGSKANSGSTLTFCAWVYITDTNPHPIIRFGDALLQMGSDTNISIYPDGADGRNNTTIPSVKNQWAHISATVNGTSATTYLNGALQQTTSGIASAMSTDSANSFIGRSSSNYLKGYVCNVGMWTSVLTQAQIKSIMWKNYAGLSTSEKTNLVSWWNLDKTIGQTIDSSINTNNSNNPTGSYQYAESLVFDEHGSFNTTVFEETFSTDIASDGGGTAGGWSLGGNVRAVGDITTVTKNGRRAIKVQNGSEDDSEAQNSVYKTIGCTVGKVYKFSCYMMTDTPMTTPTKSVRMGAYDSGEDPDGQYSAHTNATDWEYASVYMRADTTSVNFYLRSANDTGTGISNVTYFSEIKVEESSGNDGELI